MIRLAAAPVIEKVGLRFFCRLPNEGIAQLEVFEQLGESGAPAIQVDLHVRVLGASTVAASCASPEASPGAINSQIPVSESGSSLSSTSNLLRVSITFFEWLTLS
jgi:hypothetical protein